jgi:hypothetical protein
MVCAAAAWACAPSSHLVVEPAKGPPGANLTVKGQGFVPGQEVTISGPGGMLATVTPAASSYEFSIAMTMPNVPPGVYLVTASRSLAPGEPPVVVSRAAIQVTGAPAPAPSPVADVSPGPTQLLTAKTGTTDYWDVTFEGASRDGRRVWFGSPVEMTNDDFTGSLDNVFERADGLTSWVSGPLWVRDPMNPTFGAYFSAASKDGSRVFFVSTGRLTSADNDSAFDVYERSGGVLKLISKAAAGGVVSGSAEFGGISEDGDRVFFTTDGQLTSDDDDDRRDLYEHADGVTRLVSMPTATQTSHGSAATFAGASADGTRVFFTTYDQLTADDTDGGLKDVYERAAGVTTLVTRGNDIPASDHAEANFADVSRDGSRVFFHTRAKLTADDDDSGHQDVYERSGGVTKLVSKPTGRADPDTGDARFAAISDDGSRAFFSSEQQLTPDDDDGLHVDVYERAGGATTLVSEASQEGLITPADHARFGAITGDGSRVYFDTAETMTADDSDTLLRDVFERSAGSTTLISKASGVADPDDGLGSEFRGVSEDGSVVYFDSGQRLVAGDVDAGQQDVYRRANGVTTLISRPAGVSDPGSHAAWFLDASADGSIVFFASHGRYSTDDFDEFEDIYSVGARDPASADPPGPGAGDPPAQGSPTEVPPPQAATSQAAPAGPPPASSDTTAPRLTALRLSPQRLRLSRRGLTARAASSQISFRLSEAAVVTLNFERVLRGRRSGGRCQTPTPSNLAGKACKRYVPVAGAISRRAQAGITRIRFNGRIGRGGALTAGAYRMVAGAVDDAGNNSAKRRASLTVLAATPRP